MSRGALLPFARDAEHLDRLLADTDLFERLRENNFTGPDWDYVATDALIRYGLAVLTAWLRTGEIWEQLARRGIRGLPAPLEWEWTEDTWNTLTIDTLVVAVRKFRDSVLRTGRWDPRKGASLRTFFIGQCLYCFPNPYRSWHSAARARQAEWPGDAEEYLHSLPHPRHGVETQVVLEDQVAQELAALDPRTRRVLQLREQGYGQAEIGDILGVPRKTVENIICRLPKQGRKRRGA